MIEVVDDKYEVAWGDSWLCRDCGAMKGDLEELKKHECDNHHKKKSREHEERYFS